MAKTNEWGDPIAPTANPRDWGDKPEAQRDLPAGVKPSEAGGGRGSVNPAPAIEPEPIAQGDPMGSGMPEMLAQAQPARESVLEDQPAQPEAFSMRKYSAAVNALDDPRATAPQLRLPGKFVPTPGPRSAGDVARDVAFTAATIPSSALNSYGDVASVLTGGAVGPGMKETARKYEASLSEDLASPQLRAEQREFRRTLDDSNSSSIDVAQYLLTHPTLAGNQGASAIASLAIPLNVIKAAKLAGFVLTPARATSIAMSVNDLMNAGQAFNDTDSSVGGKYVAAAVAGAGSRAVGRLTEGGMEGALARQTASGHQTAARELLKSALVKEPAQEFGENASQQVGQDLGEGNVPDLNAAAKQGTAGAIIAPLAAGTMALPSLRPAKPDVPTAEELARSKGFLVQTERIKKLREAGEKEVADTLQRRLDSASAESELKTLADQPFAQAPGFQEHYRQLRQEGVKPAEASSRAAMTSGFEQLAGQAGVTPKAIQAGLTQARKQGLEEVPGFLDRYLAALTSKGIGTPVGQGVLSDSLTAAREEALDATTEHLYDSPKETADAITKLEEQAPVASQNPENVSGNAGSPEDAAFDSGHDIALTPEAEQAHQAATSPLSELPEPTDAQKAAGNYKVGRLRIAGMDISVENPQGSTRRGKVDPNAPWEKPWETVMHDHYGYFTGTTGADGDKLDVFVKPGTPSDYKGPVYVIDQVDPETGKFDEHKVVLGAPTQGEAERTYRSNYAPGWNGLGAITELPLAAFKAWAKSGTLKEPLGDLSQVRAEAPPAKVAEEEYTGPTMAEVRAVQDIPTTEKMTRAMAIVGDKEFERRAEAKMKAISAQTEDQKALAVEATAIEILALEHRKTAAEPVESLGKTGTRNKSGDRARASSIDANPFKAFIAKHGIHLSERSEFAPGTTEQRKAMVPGYGPIFRNSGEPIDTLVQKAIEEGFLPQDGEADGDTRLRTMITEALGGKRIIAQYAQGAAEAEAQTRYERHLQEQQDSSEDPLGPLSEADLEGIDVEDLSGPEREAFAALVAAAEDEGIDTEAILETAAKLAQNGTDDDYRKAGVALIAEARASRRPAAAGAGAEQGRGQAEPEGGSRDQPLPGQQGQARGEVDAADAAGAEATRAGDEAAATDAAAGAREGADGPGRDGNRHDDVPALPGRDDQAHPATERQTVEPTPSREGVVVSDAAQSLVELRKRHAVLRSLRLCLEA